MALLIIIGEAMGLYQLLLQGRSGCHSSLWGFATRMLLQL